MRDVVQGQSSGKYLTWEVPDPERWVPDGYVIVVADARGSGKSAGYLELMSRQQRENQDCLRADRMGRRAALVQRQGRHCSAISYLAINQWSVAALNPPHLAAICPWEGFWTITATSATTAAS